jgi:hypothetical protein
VCRPPAAARRYGGRTPFTGAQRVDWIVDVRSAWKPVVVGPLAVWQTGFNTPDLGAGPRGIINISSARRVAISNSIEAGLGALWGEDPHIPSGRRHLAACGTIKTVFLAQGRDGR